MVQIAVDWGTSEVAESSLHSSDSDRPIEEISTAEGAWFSIFVEGGCWRKGSASSWMGEDEFWSLHFNKKKKKIIWTNVVEKYHQTLTVQITIN